MKKLLILIGAVVVLAGAGLVYRKVTGGPSFDVGDCVRVEPRATDFDLLGAACDAPSNDLDPDGTVYRIVDLVDGASSSCPGGPWSYEVEFSHEPDDMTYCLERADARSRSGSGEDDDFGGDGAPPECLDAALDGTPMPDFCAEYGY